MKKNVMQRGLTLIELIVVIVIIGVLAGVLLAVINPGGRAAQARDAKIKADVARIAVALEAYYATNLNYPCTRGGLTASGDLKTLPKQPGSGEDYGYTTDPATCTTSASNVSVWAVMKKDTTMVWCWRSVTGQALREAGTGCSTAAPVATTFPQ